MFHKQQQNKLLLSSPETCQLARKMENPTYKVLYLRNSRLGFLRCNVVASFFPLLISWKCPFIQTPGMQLWLTMKSSPARFLLTWNRRILTAEERWWKQGTWLRNLNPTFFFLLQKKEPYTLTSEGSESVYGGNFFLQKVNHTQLVTWAHKISQQAKERIWNRK